MKTRIPALVLIGCCAVAADALVNLGDGRIELQAASALHYDSSITASSAKLDDIVFAIAPSLVYIRPSPHLDLRASAGVRVERYLDYTEFNDENFFFDVSVNPDTEVRTSRFTFNGDLILRSETRSEEDIGQIVTTRRYGVSGRLIYDPNPRYNLVLDAAVSRDDPDNDAFNRIDRMTSALTLQIAAGENRFANVGVRYGAYRPDAPFLPDSDTAAYFAGLSGGLLPKLQGAVLAGYQTRSLQDGPDTNSPYLLARLTWRQSETTAFNLSATSQFGATINNFNTESRSLSLSASRQLNPRWDASAALGYLETKYQNPLFPDRKDEEVFGQLQTGRRLADWGRLGLEVRYSRRSSDSALFDYSRLRAGLVFDGRW